MKFLSDDGKVFNTLEECKDHESTEKIKQSGKPQWMKSDKYKLLIDKYTAAQDLIERVYDEIDEFADDIGLSHEDFFIIFLDSCEERLEEQIDDCKNCDETECSNHPSNKEEDEFDFDDELKLVDASDLIQFVTDSINEYFGI